MRLKLRHSIAILAIFTGLAAASAPLTIARPASGLELPITRIGLADGNCRTCAVDAFVVAPVPGEASDVDLCLSNPLTEPVRVSGQPRRGTLAQVRIAIRDQIALATVFLGTPGSGGRASIMAGQLCLPRIVTLGDGTRVDLLRLVPFDPQATEPTRDLYSLIFGSPLEEYEDLSINSRPVGARVRVAGVAGSLTTNTVAAISKRYVRSISLSYRNRTMPLSRCRRSDQVRRMVYDCVF